MSSEEFEKRFQHHVEFMLEQQARFDERITKLEETQARQAENIDRLAESQAELGKMVADLARQAEADRQIVNSLITEMREGFDNLIVANEVTRKLSEDVAKLTVQNSQRITSAEKRLDDLESSRG